MEGADESTELRRHPKNFRCSQSKCKNQLFFLVFFKKMGHSRPLFSLFSSFQYTVDSKQMFNIYAVGTIL